MSIEDDLAPRAPDDATRNHRSDEVLAETARGIARGDLARSIERTGEDLVRAVLEACIDTRAPSELSPASVAAITAAYADEIGGAS